MREYIKTFLNETDGAVVADYVVLTATLVSMGISSVNAVRNGVGSLSDSINAALSQASVAALCAAQSGASLSACTASAGTGTDGTTSGTGGTGTGGTGGTVTDGTTRDGSSTDGSATTDGSGTTATPDNADATQTYSLLSTSAREADSYQNQLRLSSSAEIARVIEDADRSYFEAISASDRATAALYLDQYFLALQVYGERPGNDAMAAEYAARFERAVAYFNNR